MKSEMHEGPQAFKRFREAMKTVLSVPKPKAIKKAPKRKKPAASKG